MATKNTAKETVKKEEVKTLLDNKVEIKGDVYDLVFNLDVVAVIERTQGINVMREIMKEDGLLSLSLLEVLFRSGVQITESQTEKIAKRFKEKNPNRDIISDDEIARQLYEDLLSDYKWMGAIDVIEKAFMFDMGFLFQES